MSLTAFRDISSLRVDFHAALSEAGLLPWGVDSADPYFNENESNYNLVKSLIVGSLWPRVAKVVLPKAMFDRVAAGAQRREHQAKEVKYYEENGRVFMHPASTLFSSTAYKSRFVVYFSKVETNKPYIRDVTEVSGLITDSFFANVF